MGKSGDHRSGAVERKPEEGRGEGAPLASRRWGPRSCRDDRSGARSRSWGPGLPQSNTRGRDTGRRERGAAGEGPAGGERGAESQRLWVPAPGRRGSTEAEGGDGVGVVSVPGRGPATRRGRGFALWDAEGRAEGPAPAPRGTGRGPPRGGGGVRCRRGPTHVQDDGGAPAQRGGAGVRSGDGGDAGGVGDQRRPGLAHPGAHPAQQPAQRPALRRRLPEQPVRAGPAQARRPLAHRARRRRRRRPEARRPPPAPARPPPRAAPPCFSVPEAADGAGPGAGEGGPGPRATCPAPPPPPSPAGRGLGGLPAGEGVRPGDPSGPGGGGGFP